MELSFVEFGDLFLEKSKTRKLANEKCVREISIKIFNGEWNFVDKAFYWNSTKEGYYFWYVREKLMLLLEMLYYHKCPELQEKVSFQYLFEKYEDFMSTSYMDRETSLKLDNIYKKIRNKNFIQDR